MTKKIDLRGLASPALILSEPTGVIYSGDGMGFLTAEVEGALAPLPNVDAASLDACFGAWKNKAEATSISEWPEESRRHLLMSLNEVLTQVDVARITVDEPLLADSIQGWVLVEVSEPRAPWIWHFGSELRAVLVWPARAG